MSVIRESAGLQMVELRERDGERNVSETTYTVTNFAQCRHGMSPSERLGSGDLKILCHPLLEQTAAVRSARTARHPSDWRVRFLCQPVNMVCTGAEVQCTIVHKYSCVHTSDLFDTLRCRRFLWQCVTHVRS